MSCRSKHYVLKNGIMPCSGTCAHPIFMAFEAKLCIYTHVLCIHYINFILTTILYMYTHCISIMYVYTFCTVHCIHAFTCTYYMIYPSSCHVQCVSCVQLSFRPTVYMYIHVYSIILYT